jgi:hypothetical protein
MTANLDFSLSYYVFIHGLFDDAVGSSRYVTLNDRIISKEYGGKRFEVQYQCLPRGTE